MSDAAENAAPAGRLTELLHRLTRRPRLALLLLCLALWTLSLRSGSGIPSSQSHREATNYAT